ncbi:MAG: Lipoprotein-releasing system ATP-binding protein LolD [Planctomycetes bacterium ADurb.Bin126]|nr:MAG: Lipoprotein-releasing system ATP-binding protein LolD [Planctomycetes bacterium ADurb.Bin126]HOD80535.1 ABC transporter ATP-binding protein [Phycisphaerae bacterium]HQL72376.1 ABC transporter ATP-binding protein [Phycisphaerae bacterium]
MTADKPLMELSHVSRRYGGGEQPTLEVLRDVSLELRSGETLAVVGPSGCGKSTLLNIVGALDRPDGGSVCLAGRDIASLGEAELADVRARRIGFVFQLHHLLPQCTIWENVLVPTLAVRQDPTELVDRAARLLGRMGLSTRLHHRPAELSGGERQRAAVVRALINRPDLLLADEPTGSLDRQSSQTLADLLVELNREEGVALVVVTHSPALAARMEHVLELRDGELVEPE